MSEGDQRLMDAERENLRRIASIYDVHRFDALMRHYMVRSLRPHHRPGNAIELGCFQGEFTELLSQEFADLTVVDAAEEFLSATRARVPERVKFIHSLFEELDTGATYDNVFMSHILEHLQEAVPALARARALLSPRGRLLVVVPNGNAPSRQIAVKMGLIPTMDSLTAADIKHGHRRVYFFDSLERDVKAAGLKVVAKGGVFFKALANFQMDQVIERGIVDAAYLEGCYQLGLEYPQLCASIFVVCEA